MTRKDIKIISHDVEGFSASKRELLASLEPDILCIQETRRELHNSPKVPGMHLTISSSSPIYGSAIFIKDPANVLRTEQIQAGEMELLKLETDHLVNNIGIQTAKCGVPMAIRLRCILQDPLGNWGLQQPQYPVGI